MATRKVNITSWVTKEERDLIDRAVSLLPYRPKRSAWSASVLVRAAKEVIEQAEQDAAKDEAPYSSPSQS